MMHEQTGDGNGVTRGRFFWLLAAIAACFCIFVLTLPAFPTEDGPIHLYFATILGDLLSHSSPLYAQYFYVHHLLPPYSLHYYLLIALMKLVSAPMAEKLFVCLIFCTFAFGFRYLLIGIGRGGDVLSLFVGALLLNWPLGMGFENFSLSLGMACWALGIWVRLQSLTVLRYRVTFVLLLGVMTLTHPVPVVLTVGFAATDLVLQTITSLAWKQHRKLQLADWITLFAGASMLAYIYLYTDKKRSIAEAHHHPAVPSAQLKHFARLNGLAYFGGHDLGGHLYRYSLYLVFAVALGLAVRSAVAQVRRREWTPALSWLVAAILFIPALAVLPIDINGSHFFAERLVIFVWIALLAAASGSEQMGRLAQQCLAAVAIAIAIGVLGMAQLHTRPVAQQLAQLENEPIADRGKIGLLMPADSKKYDFSDHLQFYPLTWGGAYYFRRSGSILLNTPWMDLSLLPLGATPQLLTAEFPLGELENYHELRDDMLQSTAASNKVMPRLDFVLFAGAGSNVELAVTQPVLQLQPAAKWDCSTGSWYELCRK